MIGTTTPASMGSDLHFTSKVLVFVDVVESVRLMRQHESDVITRWLGFIAEVQAEVLPAAQGVLVKSYGDGLLLAFDEPPSAVHAALALQRCIAPYNANRPIDAHILLRVGVHAGAVTASAIDLQGIAVNDAQRICSLAQPGEVLLSSEVRDHLVPGIDPEPEDLGERFARHVEAPYRVYRLSTLSAPARPAAFQAVVQLRPTLAILPFECSLGDDPQSHLGEALAYDVNAQLARQAELDVISALSMRNLKGRRLDVARIGEAVHAAYVLSGRYQSVRGELRLQVELAHAKNRTVLWTEPFFTTSAAAFDQSDPLAPKIADEVCRAILSTEMQRAVTQPLSSLENYTLLLGSISLMHRASAREFELARELLEHLIGRLGRNSTAHAWMAKWHVLRAVQGLSENPELDTARALDAVRRALDIDPRNALALAIGGLVHGYLQRDLALAGTYYGDALSANPNESLAWLFTATRHAYLGHADDAAAAAEKALRLSPLDPMRYFYDSLAATASLSEGRWSRAIELGQRSVRANRLHASTWRTLAYALAMDGRMDEARQAVQSLLAIEPSYSVSAFKQRFPGAQGPMAEPWARALAQAGLPES